MVESFGVLDFEQVFDADVESVDVAGEIPAFWGDCDVLLGEIKGSGGRVVDDLDWGRSDYADVEAVYFLREREVGVFFSFLVFFSAFFYYFESLTTYLI